MQERLEKSGDPWTYGLDQRLIRDDVASLDVIASEVARMARQQPALFMGGALLVGMWLTRAWSTSSGGPATSIDEGASRATGVWAPVGRMYF